MISKYMIGMDGESALVQDPLIMHFQKALIIDLETGFMTDRFLKNELDAYYGLKKPWQHHRGR